MIQIHLASGDITESEADAVIYSTNSNLLLSGGVGRALVARFGEAIQDRLMEAARAQLSDAPRPGSVISCKVAPMPWKLLLHTVATDETYTTDPGIVRDILIKSLDACDQTYGVHTVAVSALGCGFGDLPHIEFMRILKSVAEQYSNTDLNRITVVCNDPEYLEQLKAGL